MDVAFRSRRQRCFTVLVAAVGISSLVPDELLGFGLRMFPFDSVEQFGLNTGGFSGGSGGGFGGGMGGPTGPSFLLNLLLAPKHDFGGGYFSLWKSCVFPRPQKFDFEV